MFKTHRGLVSVLALSFIAQACHRSSEQTAASPMPAAVEQSEAAGTSYSAADTLPEPAPAPAAEAEDDARSAPSGARGLGAGSAAAPQKLLAPQAPPPVSPSVSAVGGIAADMAAG